jgi:DNA-binding phage protein
MDAIDRTQGPIAPTRVSTLLDLSHILSARDNIFLGVHVGKVGHNADGYRDELISEARQLGQEIREKATRLSTIERELRGLRVIVYDLPRLYDLEEIDVVRRIRQAIEEAGSASEFARLCGISRQYLHDCLNSRRRPSDAILKQIGVRRLDVYVTATDKPTKAKSTVG